MDRVRELLQEAEAGTSSIDTLGRLIEAVGALVDRLDALEQRVRSAERGVELQTVPRPHGGSQ